MAKKNDLLKDAIADAKTIRDTAIAQAQMTLSEAFHPTLTKMFADRLREEDEGDEKDKEKETVDEQKKLDSSEIGSGGVAADDPGPKEPAKAARSSSDIENPGVEEETFGEGIQDLHPHEHPPVQDPYADSAGAGDGSNIGGDPSAQGGEDDLDLEAIIRELEAELLGHDQDAGMDQEVPAEHEGFDDVRAGQEVDGPVRIPRHETTEHDPEEGVSKDGKEEKTVDGVPDGKEVKPGEEVSETKDGKHEDDEEIDLDEIVREIEAESVSMRESTIADENARLKKSLKEHQEVIKLLRSTIKESVLLNSKLLYTTKIFRAFSLSESQKRRVVEQFDRAANLREAKLVYTTLAESFLNKDGNSTAKRVAAKLTEGASKVTGSTKPRSMETTILAEGDEQVARLQKLAGITKKPANS